MRMTATHRCTVATAKIAAGVVLALASSGWATPLYWDANGTGAGAGTTPSGTWGTSNFWNSDSTGGGAGAFQSATTASDDLTFVAGAAADSGNNAFAVAVTGTVSANKLTFASTGAITLGTSGTTINLGAGGISAPDKAYGTTNNAANPVINSNIVLQGNQTWAFARSTLAVNGSISGTGNLVLSGNFAKQFNAANSYVGTTSIGGANYLTLGGTAGSVGTGNIIFTDINSGLMFSQTADVTFSNNITGTGNSSSVTKNGASTTLTLTGTNTYSGGTLIRAGTLKVTSLATNLGTGTLKLGTSSDTGKLLYTGAGETTGRTLQLPGSTGGGIIQNDGDGALIFSNTGALTIGNGNKIFTLQGSNAGNNEIRGIIADSTGKTSFVKDGAGKWVLGGANTYTGTTTITAGTLIIDGSLAAGSAVTVAAAGTLGGSGTINGTVAVNGTLSPGNSAGTLTVNNTLAFGSASAGTFELGGTVDTQYDRVVGITNLTLDGTVTVSLISPFIPSNGNTFDLFDWSGTLSSSGFNVATDLVLPALPAGRSWDTSAFLTDGSISVVPEPVMGAILPAAALLLVRRRDRRG